MKIETKFAMAALALALSCGPMLAQEGPQDQTGGPGEEMLGPGPGGPEMGEGFVAPDQPGGPRGSFGPGPNRWGEQRGGFERGGRRHGEFGLSRWLSDPEIQQKVGVSAAQVAKIKEQESTFRKTEIRQRAELEVKQVELRDLLSADKPDRAAIDSKLQEMGTARLAVEKSRIDFQLNMKDALTTEQREKLRQVLRDRAKNAEGRRWSGRPGQRGPGGASRPPSGNGQAPAANPGE